MSDTSPQSSHSGAIPWSMDFHDIPVSMTADFSFLPGLAYVLEWITCYSNGTLVQGATVWKKAAGPVFATANFGLGTDIGPHAVNLTGIGYVLQDPDELQVQNNLLSTDVDVAFGGWAYPLPGIQASA